MKLRYVPYATTPGRLLAQLFSDIVVAVWAFLWVLVGLAVHSAVSTIAEVGRQVQGGADGVADSLIRFTGSARCRTPEMCGGPPTARDPWQ